jgi:endonuclease/exonuclease/phosphatase family metal-dependent hydrolase
VTTKTTSHLSVLTQNVWGGVPGWERRRLLLARALARHRPDVIGLQEVHATPADATRSGAPAHLNGSPTSGARGATAFGRLPSQAHELAAMLGGYTAYFAPARRAASGAAEGVALLCKSTAHEQAVHSLTLDSNDLLDRNNQRVVLCATIEAGSRRVDVFVTHLSLSARARLRTVFELLAFAERERRRSGSEGAVLLGDFNAPSEERAISEIEKAALNGSPWCDAWKAAHGPYARGGTWPAIMPVRRIDYVFFQPREQWSVETCERLSFAGSDHLGVTASLRLDAARSVSKSA